MFFEDIHVAGDLLEGASIDTRASLDRGSSSHGRTKAHGTVPSWIRSHIGFSSGHQRGPWASCEFSLGIGVSSSVPPRPIHQITGGSGRWKE